jgi:hypothetical protein
VPYTILTDLHYLPCLPPSPSRPVPLPLLVLLPPLPLPSSPRNALFSATQPSARSTRRQQITVPYLDDLTTPLVDGHLTLRRLPPYENSSSQTQAGTLCQCKWLVIITSLLSSLVGENVPVHRLVLSGLFRQHARWPLGQAFFSSPVTTTAAQPRRSCNGCRTSTTVGNRVTSTSESHPRTHCKVL